MIVVLDTNVIISAVLSPRGNAAEIVRRWEAGDFDIATSPSLVKELKRALSYKRIREHIKLDPKDLKRFLRDFQFIAIAVEPLYTVDEIEKDSADNRVLECAMAAKAMVIVTGDEHLLELKEYKGMVILPPSGFLRLLDV